MKVHCKTLGVTAGLLLGILLPLRHVASQPPKAADPVGESALFPRSLVEFKPFSNQPLFAGAEDDAWDAKIRERGFIQLEDGVYYLWYTGYNPAKDEVKHLGLATSRDGIHWTRDPRNPIFTQRWVEDVFVVKWHGTYYMFAEGEYDIAHQLVSTDRVHWRDVGDLDIRRTDGHPISAGPYGTPTVLIDGDTWYLLYERNDAGVWLASSKDRKVWRNVQDQPVLVPGPEKYDRFGIAMNQVMRYQGRYYGYYHGTGHKDWSLWSTNVAVSDDLVHWRKYPANPIVGENMSSGVLVPDGALFRLYTMHPEMRLFLPQRTATETP